MQLAREAFEAAREIGYKRKEIKIKLNGAIIEEKDLFTEKLEHQGQQQPQVDVDNSEGLAGLTRQGEAEIANPTKQNKQIILLFH